MCCTVQESLKGLKRGKGGWLGKVGNYSFLVGWSLAPTSGKEPNPIFCGVKICSWNNEVFQARNKQKCIFPLADENICLKHEYKRCVGGREGCVHLLPN